MNCSPGGDGRVLDYYFETRNAVAAEAFMRISAQWPALRFELRWLAEWESVSVEHLYTFEAGEVRRFAMVEEADEIDEPIK